MDLDEDYNVRVQDKDKKISAIVVSLHSFLMDIMVPSSGKPLSLMIVATGDGEFEGVVPTGREHEGEATKITKHVASAIMYYLIFIIKADPEDISKFI